MLNEIRLHGRLGKDPELTERQGQKGPYKSVLFTMAVDRDFGDGCDWFLCTMNGRRAEVIDKYFSKGSEIIVMGRMESYKPKNDPDHTAWIVKMSGFDFCGSSSDNSKQAGSKPAPKQAEAKQSSFEDLPDNFEEQEEDIPF